jgi:hypothetical protein
VPFNGVFGLNFVASVVPEIRVIIVEDQTEIRDGLAVLIQASEGFTCPHRFASMEAALEGLERDTADVGAGRHRPARYVRH